MKRMRIWIAVLLILVLLTGCGGNATQGDWDVTAQPDTEFGTEDTDQKDENKNPTTDDSSKDDSTTDDSTTEEPSNKEPSAGNADTKEPATDEPTDKEPVKDEPSTDAPTKDEPAKDEPADDSPKGSKLGLMSLNIYHANPAKPNNRELRVQRIGKVLADYRPAVVGMQEVRSWWMNDLDDSNPGIPDVMPASYKEIHYYRDEKFVQSAGYGPESREGCAILYDTAVVTLLKEGRFWLSDYPDRETKFPDSDCPRIAVWGKFKVNATNEEFYFYTAHLSTGADKVKLQDLQIAQLEVIREQMAVNSKKYGEAPIVLCGDFNLRPTDLSYATIASEMTDVGGALGDGGTTFPHWGANKWSDKVRIDYFFIDDAWTALRYEVDQRVFDPETDESKTLNYDPAKNEYGYYSDHAPVYVELQFNS